MVQDFKEIKASWFVKQKWFNNKLTNFEKKLPKKKAKCLEVPKRLNNVTKQVYNFWIGGMYFEDDHSSQNMFVYQPILDTLELKTGKGTDHVRSWK